jgi:hypothetical protein
MMKEESAYTAVPTSPKDGNAATAPCRRRFKTVRAVGYFVLFMALIGLFADDEDASHGNHHHHHYMRHHDCWNKKRHAPMKLPGGGRDWLVNVQDRTIVAKHNPSLVLGIDTSFPLVLTTKGSTNQLFFGPPPTDENQVVPLLSNDHKLGVVVDDKQHIGEMHYRDAKVVENPSNKDVVTVSYPQQNFIALESFKSWCTKHKMMLDVAFWNLSADSKVKFVEGPHWDSFQAGGGRDFVWNQDGTISTKLNPSLVLGKAPPSLVLVDKNSPNKLVLENIQDLANGKTVSMTLVDGRVVSTRKDTPQEVGPWQYMESQISYEGNAVSIRYDGNYILADNDEFALDVSFWDVRKGTTVNFVGSYYHKEVKQKIETYNVEGESSSSDTLSSKGSNSNSDDSSSSSDDSDSSDEGYKSDVDVKPIKVKMVKWAPAKKESVSRLRGGI